MRRRRRWRRWQCELQGQQGVLQGWITCLGALLAWNGCWQRREPLWRRPGLAEVARAEGGARRRLQVACGSGRCGMRSGPTSPAGMRRTA